MVEKKEREESSKKCLYRCVHRYYTYAIDLNLMFRIYIERNFFIVAAFSPKNSKIKNSNQQTKQQQQKRTKKIVLVLLFLLLCCLFVCYFSQHYRLTLLVIFKNIPQLYYFYAFCVFFFFTFTACQLDATCIKILVLFFVREYIQLMGF